MESDLDGHPLDKLGYRMSQRVEMGQSKEEFDSNLLIKDETKVYESDVAMPQSKRMNTQ